MMTVSAATGFLVLFSAPLEAQRSRPATKKAELVLAEKTVLVSFDTLGAPEEFVQSISGLSPGQTLAWSHGRAIKLTTEVDLVFAAGTLKQGNASPDYPGVYSVWPKRTDRGWSLVFNEYADVWGSMHDPSGDELEVAAIHSDSEEATDLLVELEEGNAGAASLTLRWGKHVWRSSFEARP